MALIVCRYFLGFFLVIFLVLLLRLLYFLLLKGTFTVKALLLLFFNDL